VAKANRVRDTFFGSICSLIATFILLMVFMAGVASLVKIWPYAFTNPERYPQIWTLKNSAGDTAPAAAMCMLIVFANVIVHSLAELVSRRFKRRTQGWRER
jgi:thiosulfate reductase cytochrome b subunit